MTQDTYSIYQQIIRSMNVGISFWGSDYSQISTIDYHLREQLFPEGSYTKFIEIFQKSASSQSLLKIKDSFSIYYYFYNAPEVSPDGKLYFCIGPILRDEITPQGMTEILTKHKLAKPLIPELFSYYNQLPVIENLPVFEKTLLAVTSGLFNRKLSLTTLSETALKVNISQHPVNSHSSPTLSNTIENMYQLENQIMEAVSIGNAELAKKYISMQNQIHFHERLVANPLRSMKNRLIVFSVLLRKAIEKGGVHPIYIDDISARYSVRIENAVSVLELSHLNEEMVDAYCLLVRTRTVKDYHPLIQRCTLYIEQHYSETLTLTSLADIHYVSRQYLSALFKSETGINITDYIQKCQTQHAAILLEESNLSVAQTAEACGFKHADYFSKIFKKYYGITPREYRNSKVNEV